MDCGRGMGGDNGSQERNDFGSPIRHAGANTPEAMPLRRGEEIQGYLERNQAERSWRCRVLIEPDRWEWGLAPDGDEVCAAQRQLNSDSHGAAWWEALVEEASPEAAAGAGALVAEAGGGALSVGQEQRGVWTKPLS